MFNITSDFLDDFEKHPIREILSYHHKLQYETDEEVESIEVENLPKGLFFRNGVISGNMFLLNSFHPIKDYESKEIQGRDDNEIFASDVYETVDSDCLATIGYLREHKHIPHYTGRVDYLFGAKAWVRDNLKPILHKVTFKVKTKENQYIIEKHLPLAPLFSNKHFLSSYSKVSTLKINGKEVSLSEFVKTQKDIGFKIF